MFNTLKRASQTVPKVDVTNEDIENLKRMDLNLFPMYGDIKMASPKDNDLNNILDPANKDVTEQEFSREKFIQDIEAMLKKMKDEFPEITDQIRSIEQFKSSQNIPKINVDTSSTEVLRKCNEHLKILNQVSRCSFLKRCKFWKKTESKNSIA